jgi:hypothetical protein
MYPHQKQPVVIVADATICHTTMLLRLGKMSRMYFCAVNLKKLYRSTLTAIS